MKLFLVFILVAVPAFYFKDAPLLEIFRESMRASSQEIKKASAVKPKSLLKKIEVLQPVSPRFTFFETLDDPEMKKYVGLKGEILPVSLPQKPAKSIFQSTTQLPVPAKPEPEEKAKSKTEEIVSEEKTTSAPEVLPFSVQVSSFRDEKRAGAMKMQLREKGFDAFLMATELPGRGGKWHRVFLGRYSDETLAREAAKRARQEHKLNAVVVRKTN